LANLCFSSVSHFTRSNPLLAPALILSNPEQANHNEKTEEQSYRNIQACVIKPDSENGDEQNRQHARFDSFEKVRSLLIVVHCRRPSPVGQKIKEPEKNHDVQHD
jgi:hypothetical protein